MIGGIIGDIAGSAYEHTDVKITKLKFFEDGSHYSDDSVLAIAVADALINKKEYATTIKYWARKYPEAGYGKFFKQWMLSDEEMQAVSFGNGAAMRVAPVGYFCNTLDEVLQEAHESTKPTHYHPDSRIGAQAVAGAILLARQGKSKLEIKAFVESISDYDLNVSLQHHIATAVFDSTCKVTVPQAVIAFLESNSFVDALEKAISIGGDTDTIGCMTGAIAEAYYKEIPEDVLVKTLEMLPEDMKEVLGGFYDKVNVPWMGKRGR
jgi:ADP-ribosylglycohydrolase